MEELIQMQKEYNDSLRGLLDALRGVEKSSRDAKNKLKTVLEETHILSAMSMFNEDIRFHELMNKVKKN